MMYNDWFLVEIPTEHGKRIVLTSRIGLALWKTVITLTEACEKLNPPNACCSRLSEEELRGQDSQGQGLCI